MFNKKIIIVSVILTALLTGCAENSAPYGAGFGDTDASRAPDSSIDSGAREPSSVGAGGDASYAGTGVLSPTTDDGAVDNELFANTRTVGYHKLEQITAGMTYGEILDTLGSTAAFGYTAYRQYRTFDDRIIQLKFNSKDDICPYSGAELFNNAMPLRDDPHGNLTIAAGCGGLVTYLTEDNALTPMSLITSDAKITFEDGSPASEDDLKTGTAILFETTGEVLCSYPGQAFCTAITILDVKPSPAEAPYDETLEDGSVITYYPDGVTVTKFPSGGVETYLPYPDGGVLEYKPPVTDPDTSIDTEDLFHELTTINREQMSDIPANSSYGDILEKLGSTQAYGQPKYRQYVTDDDRIIQLYFDSMDDLCLYSGEELYDHALPLEYDGETPDGMIYGILGRDGGFFTHYMMYYYTDKAPDIYEDENGERYITGDYLISNEAEIVFEDGSPATQDDLKPDTPVFVQSDYVLESYPGQRHCTKIVILK